MFPIIHPPLRNELSALLSLKHKHCFPKMENDRGLSLHSNDRLDLLLLMPSKALDLVITSSFEERFNGHNDLVGGGGSRGGWVGGLDVTWM